MVKSVVIFCSSSSDTSPVFFSEIENLARLLAKNKIQIVYGGSCVGLMGHLANVALQAGGRVVGVIPRYLAKPGIVHEHLTELIIVDDLLDRKKKMLSLADVAIACPGGVGTIDEITEVMALKQLSEHNKPIIFHNFLDFWEPMFDFFAELKARHMIHQNLEDIYHTAQDAKEVLDKLRL